VIRISFVRRGWWSCRATSSRTSAAPGSS